MEDVLRILVATDNHLGYMERDGIRGNDSFKTFEEILNLAHVHEVDFVLLSGDLFHDSRPTPTCMHKAIALIREYSLGCKPVEFEILSDPSVNFANTSFVHSNYVDPNINVGLPIFSIHGNHDDPSGPGGTCALDILHASGLVNLFGKYNSADEISCSPILLQKGKTKVALFGLGAAHEERLHRLFANGKVTFSLPESGDWFNMICVHQNRARHGPTGYLPENFLPDFLDLVIWGHEHECRLAPEWNGSQNFFVSQPGSSVATSLSEGEAVPKACGLLEITGKEFKLSKLELRTVRPFFMRDIVLQDEPASCGPKVDPKSEEAVEHLCSKIVEEKLQEATMNSMRFLQTPSVRAAFRLNFSFCKVLKGSHRSFTAQPPVEPLLRIRVDVSGGYESFSVLRFGQKFVGRVANPKDLISFHRRREQRGFSTKPADENNTDLDTPRTAPDGDHIETVLCRKLEGGSELQCLTRGELCQALRLFIGKENNEAISQMVADALRKTAEHLRIAGCPADQVEKQISRFSSQRNDSDAKENRPPSPCLLDTQDMDTNPAAVPCSGSPTKSAASSDCFDDSFMNSESEDAAASKPRSSRGRGRRGRPPGRRQTAGRSIRK